jgi:hypothetical protein
MVTSGEYDFDALIADATAAEAMFLEGEAREEEAAAKAQAKAQTERKAAKAVRERERYEARRKAKVAAEDWAPAPDPEEAPNLEGVPHPEGAPPPADVSGKAAGVTMRSVLMEWGFRKRKRCDICDSCIANNVSKALFRACEAWPKEHVDHCVACARGQARYPHICGLVEPPGEKTLTELVKEGKVKTEFFKYVRARRSEAAPIICGRSGQNRGARAKRAGRRCCCYPSLVGSLE